MCNFWTFYSCITQDFGIRIKKHLCSPCTPRPVGRAGGAAVALGSVTEHGGRSSAPRPDQLAAPPTQIDSFMRVLL